MISICDEVLHSNLRADDFAFHIFGCGLYYVGLILTLQELCLGCYVKALSCTISISLSA